MPVRIAVIGAGAAGLCCARYLASRPDHFTLTVFEKAAVVGGTWVYEASGCDKDEFGQPTHSSVYKNLRCVGVRELADVTENDYHACLW